MKKEELQTIFNSMQEKIGDENYTKMADDLAKIITDNEQMNNTIQKRDDKIKDLEKSNNILVTANGNLLQQVAMGEDNISNQNENKDTEKKYSFKNSFDANGNFK